MPTTPALFARQTLGPLPDDILASMIRDAENTGLHDSCDVPGVYFQLLVLPALRELKALRLKLRADMADSNVLTLPQGNRGCSPHGADWPVPPPSRHLSPALRCVSQPAANIKETPDGRYFSDRQYRDLHCPGAAWPAGPVPRLRQRGRSAAPLSAPRRRAQSGQSKTGQKPCVTSFRQMMWQT